MLIMTMIYILIFMITMVIVITMMVVIIKSRGGNGDDYDDVGNYDD